MVETKVASRRLIAGFAIGSIGAVLVLILAGMLPVRFAAPAAQPLGVQSALPGSRVSLGFVTTATASVPAWLVAQGAGGPRPIHFRAAVIDHPEGRILFGTGAADPPGPGRVINPFGATEPAAFEQPEGVDAIILPTMRWMHVGLAESEEYADVPIRVGQSDHWYAFRGPWPGRYGFDRAALAPLESRIEKILWTRSAHLGFPKSHDYFGDGSVMLVALNGATKDEVAVSVVLDSGRRVLIVGDAVWALEDVTERQRHAQWLAWTMDRNRTQLLATQSRLHQLWRDYELEIIPLLDGTLQLPTYPDVWR